MVSTSEETTIKELVGNATDLVETEKKTPKEACQIVLSKAWGSLSNEDRFYMASVGFAHMIGDEANRRRYREDIDYHKIREMHKATCCNLNNHYSNTQKARECLSSILDKPESEWPKAIEERKQRNLKWSEESGERLAESAQRMHKKINEAVAELITNVLGGIILKTKDGMKSLLDFNLADIRCWERQSNVRAKSWGNRSNWFKEAKEKMKANKTKLIKELPNEELTSLSEKAQKVWKKV